MRVTADQLFVLALTAALMVGLHLLLTRTTLGRAMRAMSENPALLAVTGIDPAAVARWTCVIGGGLAAVAGVLIGLTVQVRPLLGFELLLPLFAAVILGGVGSVYGALAGSLIVGARRGAGRAAHRRGVPRRRRLPRADRRAAGAAGRARGAARVIGDVFAYLVFFAVIALTYALACLGLNLQWGVTGLFNVGVAGFVAVGAYTSAILTAPPSPDRLGGLGVADRGRLAGRRAGGGRGGARGRRRHPAAAPRLPGHRDLRHRGDDPAPGHEPRPAHRRAVRHPRRAAAVRRCSWRARSAATSPTLAS